MILVTLLVLSLVLWAFGEYMLWQIADQRRRSDRLRERISQYEGAPVRLGLRTRWDV